MQLGELFVSLGFKSKGTTEINVFNSAVGASKESVDLLSAAMEKMIFLLEEMAVTSGAITREQLTKIKLKEKEAKAIDQTEKSEKKDNKTKRDKVGILSTVNKKMRDYWGNLATARLQLIGGTSALVYFTKKASDAAVHIDRIATLTGLSTGKIQELGDMAAQSGGSVDDIAGAVANFQKQSVDIMLGRGGNIGVFQFLGIDPHQDPLKILDQLSIKLKTMPRALGVTMAKDLGLSEELIYMLMNKENIKPADPQTFVTERELKRLKDFNFYFNRVFEQGKRVMMKFAAALTPITRLVVYFFDRTGSMFADLLTNMNPFFQKLEKYLPWLALLGGAIFAAFFPLLTALTIIALAMEDIWGYMRGDDSLFGRWLKQVQNINGAMRTALELLMWAASITFGGDEARWLAMVDEGMVKVRTAMNKMGIAVDAEGQMTMPTDKLMGDFTAGRGTVLSKPFGAIGSNKSVTNNISPIFNVTVVESKDAGATAREVYNQIAAGTFWQAVRGEQ